MSLFRKIYTSTAHYRGGTSGEFIQQAAGTTTDYTLTWPSTAGAANQLLKCTDGAGTMEWGEAVPAAVGDLTNVYTNATTGQLLSIDTEFDNVFLGQSAGQANVSATQSVIIGDGAGAAALTGADNVLVGLNAGSALISGNSNVVLGSGALANSSNGTKITAIGINSMNSSTQKADSTVSIGANSGLNVTDGNENVLIGVDTGGVITTGAGNVLIGTRADVSNLNTQNAIAIGRNVVADTNSVVLGNNDITVIRGNNDGVVDLGSTTKRFNETFSRKIVLSGGGGTSTISSGKSGTTTFYLPETTGVANNVMTVSDSSGALQLVDKLEVDSVSTNSLTCANDAIINGNLQVNGTTTTISTTNLNIEDNIIILNNGEGSSGITEGTAGIEIDRGTANNVNLIYDDSAGFWKAGFIGAEYQLTQNKDTAVTGTLTSFDKNGRLENSLITSSQVSVLNTMSNGGMLHQNVSKTASATLLETEHVVYVDTTTAGVTLTLPDANSNKGREFTIVYWKGGSNDLTIASSVDDKVDNVVDDSIVLDVLYQRITLVCGGNMELGVGKLGGVWFIV
jgi:hypothetical protein